MPTDFELIDRQNDATGLYYGPLPEVEELERAGGSMIPQLARGVFQRTTTSQIPGSKEASESPMFDSRTGTFLFEEQLHEILNKFPKADIEIISMRRADTEHFPILVSEVRMGRHRSNIVHIALTDDVNGVVAEIKYFMPEQPSADNLRIWNKFVSNLRER